MEANMEAVEVTWPTLLAARRQQNNAANQRSLETQTNQVAPLDTPGHNATVTYDIAPGQPNLYF